MKTNNSLLTKLDNFLSRQVDKYAKWLQNRKPRTVSFYVSNIVFALISWFLAALTSVFIYKMLPEAISEGIGKFIFIISYFGSFAFFMYFPFLKYFKKMKNIFAAPDKMEKMIDEIGKNRGSEQ